MSALSVFFELLGKVPTLFDATTRLIKAAKEPTKADVPEPPKPLGYSGAPLAEAYLRGANDEAWRLQERDRMTADAKRLGELTAQDDEDGPAEQPVDGEGKL